MISRIVLRKLRLPLRSPYRLSYRTFTEFEPFLIEIEDRDGRRAFADAHISPGSSSETRDGGWRHLTERLPKLIGLDARDGIDLLFADFAQSKVATTAAVVALESLMDEPLACVGEDEVLDLLVPVGATDPAGIEQEVNASISAGYTTLKVKVGKDLPADLARLALIQKAAAGRAMLRVDANRAYSREDAIAFAKQADPEGIMLFEQPCDADAWDDNAAVAAASDIPVMLDEPICSLADIERAADIDGVGFCKVKLKRFGGLRALYEGICAIRDHGMQAVLGDGLGSDLHGWFEAAIAARSVDTAGEFNGFIKMTGALLEHPLEVHGGSLHLKRGSPPSLNIDAINDATTEFVEFQ